MQEKTLSSKTIYDGKVVKLTVDEVELSNGRTSKREVVHHKGAVCVLAITPDNLVPLVKQFRYPFKEVMLELPAGKLDKDNEDIEEAARRELSEETGYIANELKYLGAFRPSCGAFTEVIHMYVALSLQKGEMHLDENEILNLEYYKFNDVVDMILSNEITDGKTIATVLKYNALINK